MARRDGVWRLPVTQRVGKQEPVVRRRHVGVGAGAGDGDVHHRAGVENAVEVVVAAGGGLQQGGRGEVVELGRDAGVGFSLRDHVGEGSGEVGGEGREWERQAAAPEVDVDATADLYEIEAGVACVVGREGVVVVDAEEARYVGQVLVPGDVV